MMKQQPNKMTENWVILKIFVMNDDWWMIVMDDKLLIWLIKLHKRASMHWWNTHAD